MKLIGVTGGVGSGKSEILHYMETNYRCRIVLADDVAKELEAPGGAIYEKLIRLLEEYPADNNTADSTVVEEASSQGVSAQGPGRERAPVTLEDGRINNPEMARRIFSSPGLLQEVNNLVHPAVKKYILDEFEKECGRGYFDFFVMEAALLIEAGYGKDMDVVWYIYCNEQERRRRLKASRGYSDEKIDSILKSQLREEQFRANVDVVIDNSGEIEASCRQVDEALAAYGFSKCVKDPDN